MHSILAGWRSTWRQRISFLGVLTGICCLSLDFAHAQSSTDARQVANQPVHVSNPDPATERDFPVDSIPAPSGSLNDSAAGSAKFEPTQLLDPTDSMAPERVESTLRLLLSMTVLSLAPAILMMTTSFVRFIVVFGLLRQALGLQQLPPNQVMVGLSLFMTLLVMAPVWERAYEDGIRPYTDPAESELRPSLSVAVQNTIGPVRQFMANQIEAAGNSQTVWTFLQYQRPAPGTTAAQNYREPETYEDLPLSVLLPAFVVSELKVAFLIGFQVYLPFLIIDMVVSSVLVSMGMLMLPPVLVSIPFKLLLFVLIDGWNLTVQMMLDSVSIAT